MHVVAPRSLLLLLFYISFVFVCSCMLQVHVEARGHPSCCASEASVLLFQTGSLPGTGADGLGWLASKLQGATCLCLPKHWDYRGQCWLFNVGFGDCSWAFTLSQYFTHRGLSERNGGPLI